MTDHILAAYEMDKEIRVCGREPSNPQGYGTTAHEIGVGDCYCDDNIRVESFKVGHGEGWLAFGYQFVTADRRIIVSGDTAPLDLELEQWKGCDVLVHEVYSSSGLLKRPPEWQKYHSHMHASGAQLDRIAKGSRRKYYYSPISFVGVVPRKSYSTRL